MLHFNNSSHTQNAAFLEKAEVLALLRAARQKGSREWCMLLLGYRHGLRASEVCGLLLDDIDLKNQSLTIRRLKGSLSTTQSLAQHKGEPLLDELKSLKAWLRARKPDGSRFLFTSQKGGRLDRSQFFRIFRAIAVAASLPPQKQHPHVLKHSLATHLIEANLNLAVVKQQLGHKSISSTMRYVTVNDKEASDKTTAALLSLF